MFYYIFTFSWWLQFSAKTISNLYLIKFVTFNQFYPLLTFTSYWIPTNFIYALITDFVNLLPLIVSLSLYYINTYVVYMVFNAPTLQHMYYGILLNTYIFLLIVLIVVLIIITFNYFFLGKLNFYKTYNGLFFFLFIVSFYIQLNINSFHGVCVIYDLTQNYILFKNSIINFNFDTTFLYFSTTTIQIAFFVNLFAIFYLFNDQKYEKFILLLNYFVFSMVGLIHSNNFIMIFFFWELIGITSYFLINFYELKNVSFKSAFKAFSFNRVSDVSLLLAIIIFWNATSSFSFNESIFLNFILNSTQFNIYFLSINNITLFLFFLTIAALCKSAQFGFHFWLPDSMEAPAPASALIHSATLVSAGLVLYIKFLTLYKLDIFITYFILFCSSVTVLFGSFVSAVQTDLKRLLAYSTISNCGLLFVSIILTNIKTTLLLFQFHGLTKSLAFLYVGYIIITYNHNQDTRVIGSQNFLLKYIFINMFITLSYLSAWFWAPSSLLKHLIIAPNNALNYIFYVKIILMFSVIFSVMYSLRIIFTSLSLNKKHTKKNIYFYIKYKNINTILYCFFALVIFFFYYKLLFLKNFEFTTTQPFIIILYKFFLFLFLVVSYIYFFYSHTHKIKKINFKVLVLTLSTIILALL